jgi:lipopolysaccharide/colanic/teichoic acid biosynthesis glycosyltransferase
MLRRLIDLVVGGALFTLFAPIGALIAILIRLDSRGPVLYVPKVVGLHGRLFPLLRFRTMRIAGACASPEERLTRVGRFIRAYSLDHLPLLVNLLAGDVTLVGPRPMEIEAVDLRSPVWRSYIRAKPGLMNYAVLKLGKEWTPSRARRPALNQELELAYERRRTPQSDARLFARWLWALVASRGNVKARKPADPDLEDRLG